MIPGLEERIMEGSDEDIAHIGELVSHFSGSSKLWGPESAADTEGFIWREV
jgi:hypothetical protein